MSLAVGAKLGPYEILAPLGAGGMGEVYRARDPKLNRDVAIKILPEALAADPVALARFEREAQAVAALSHPNILAIFDFGRQGATAYAVMELLEGQTLRARLEHGALPARKAVDLAVQIAEGLAAAHEKGIVHRDLKPENVFVTQEGRAKILDFGVAKRAGAAGDSGANVETAIAQTGAGMVLGTAAYMSPEQVRGEAVDHRSDIFSFGAVLYEMLTGQRAFGRETATESMTAILKEDPPEIAATGSGSSPGLQRIVQHCLEKKPAERFQSARDIAFALQALSGSAVASGPSVAVTRGGSRLWLLAAIAIAAAGVTALTAWMLVPRVPSDESRPLRFIIPAPEKSSFAGSIALSPDGRKLAFLATSNGRTSLWVRSLDSLAPQALPGTEDAASPFWSPDGRWIGFFAQGKLKKIEASGGPPQILCDTADDRGGTWNRDGVILFSRSASDGLYRVSADGGAVTRVTNLNRSGSESSHRWPRFLPDGHHFFYLILSGQSDKQGIFVWSLDSQESKRLLPSVSAVMYASPGCLIYLSQATLMIQQFDSARLQLKGQPVSVTEQVWSDSNISGLSAFSVSESGMLVYRSGGAQNNQFTWFDRHGNKLGTVGPPGRYVEPYFSADEKRIVFAITDFSGIGDLWTMDLAGGNMSRFTFDPAEDATALWSPDGERIVWTSNRSGAYEFYEKAASGAGKDELLLKSTTTKYPDDWSLDGRFILYENVDPKTRFDLWVLPMSGDHKPSPYLQTEFNETHSRFSPNGRWVAYASDESGRAEVYVQSFPATGGKWQISNGSGDQPFWRRDGKELFFVAADGKLMAAEVSQSASTFQAGIPKPLLGLHIPPIGITSIRNYVLVTADGQKFLIANSIDDAASFPITVVLNWPALLRK